MHCFGLLLMVLMAVLPILGWSSLKSSANPTHTDSESRV